MVRSTLYSAHLLPVPVAATTPASPGQHRRIQTTPTAKATTSSPCQRSKSSKTKRPCSHLLHGLLCLPRIINVSSRAKPSDLLLPLFLLSLFVIPQRSGSLINLLIG